MRRGAYWRATRHKLTAALARTGLPLHVGLDLLFWHPRAGGMARYARELIGAMRAVEPDLRVTAYVSRELPPDAPQALGDGVHVVRYPVNVTHDRSMAANLWAHWGRIAAHAARSGVDVVHGPANFAPVGGRRVARVVTLHDLIWLRDGAASLGWPATLVMRRTALPSAWRADRVITGAQAGQDDICATLRIDPSARRRRPARNRADPPRRPTDEHLLRRRLDLGDAPVVLCVAQKRAHKNLDGLIHALALLDDDGAMLVLPGEPTAHEAELLALAAELGVADRVRIPAGSRTPRSRGSTRSPRSSRCRRGRRASACRSSRRCVAARRSHARIARRCRRSPATPPTCSIPTTRRRSPRRSTACSARRGARAELVARGRSRCEQFTWERSARLTLESYRRAIAGARGRPAIVRSVEPACAARGTPTSTARRTP